MTKGASLYSLLSDKDAPMKGAFLRAKLYDKDAPPEHQVSTKIHSSLMRYLVWLERRSGKIERKSFIPDDYVEIDTEDIGDELESVT